MSIKNNYKVDLVKIEDIIITNARIDNNSQITVLEKGKYIYDIKTNFSFAVNPISKRAKVVFSCSLETIKVSNEEKIDINANFDIAFIFIVENLVDLIGEGPNFIENSDLIVSLSNIAYSTSRGIVFTRCQGTVIKSFILPILSTPEIIKIHKIKKRKPSSKIAK